jgi:hypothetical protein
MLRLRFAGARRALVAAALLPLAAAQLLGAAALLLLGACQHMAPSPDEALRAGLKMDLVQGGAYKHVTFANASSTATPLYVFIEGDGLPWRSQGTRVSPDPTPRNALALALAIRTPGSRLYLGRPCYFAAINDLACSPRVWTSERFSPTVVASMAAVVNRYCVESCRGGVVLIGYSGGGVLAVLMAPLVPSTVAVVTIAADLDIDAWARRHDYSALEGSLNPATLPPLPSRIREWHLVGDRDTVAPPELNRRYLDRVKTDYVWHFATFDHVCCWAQQWPELFFRIEAAVSRTLVEPSY